MRRIVQLVVAAAVIATALAAVPAPAGATTGGWFTSGPMNTARQEHKLVALADGGVLALDGYTMDGSSKQDLSGSSERFDPDTRTWRSTAPSSGTAGSVVLLPDGRVLMSGGRDSGTTAATELYNPVSDTWSVGPPMPAPRRGHELAVLANGLVAAVGGSSPSGGFDSVTAAVDIFDPAANEWRTAATLPHALPYVVLAPQPDGKLLVFSRCCKETDPIQLLDLATGETTVVGHGSGTPSRSIALPDGRIFDSHRMFDHSSGWSAVSPGPTKEAPVKNVLLADGRVVANYGPYDYDGRTAIYDPASQSWEAAPRAPSTVIGLTTVTTTSGLMLRSGGQSDECGLNESVDCRHSVPDTYVFDPGAPPPPPAPTVRVDHGRAEPGEVASFTTLTTDATTGFTADGHSLLVSVVAGPNAGAAVSCAEGDCRQTLSQFSYQTRSGEATDTYDEGTDTVKATIDLNDDGIAQASEPYGTNKVYVYRTGYSVRLTARPVVAASAVADAQPLVPFEARLTQNNQWEVPLVGYTVRFLIGKTTVCRAVTDELGYASCGSPEDFVAATRNQGYVAWFKGDETWGSKTARAVVAGAGFLL